jgi:large subunit ribosomal protein L18
MKVAGTALRPRLAVFRSGRHIYAQIIDDVSAKTLAASSDLALTKGKEKCDFRKVTESKLIGLDIAKKAAEKKITKVVFDRGGYIYTGRVKAVAEGAREGGLEF